MRLLTLAALLISSWTRLPAQFDTDGPNAALTVQGETPSAHDPWLHDFLVGVPGSLSLRIFSGANTNQPLTLLTSFTDPTVGGVIPTPWGGSIDLGSLGAGIPADISVFGDGIGFTTNPIWDALFVTDGGSGGTPPAFRFDAGLHPAWAGIQVAFQAVVRDPAMPPFLLDNTEAASVHFALSQTVVPTTGDDGYQQVPFLPGFTFDFHGVTYSDVWVHANGFLTFGAPTSLPDGGATTDNMSAVNAEPAIFVGKGDWDPTALSWTAPYYGPGGIVVTQLGPEFSVEWGGVAAPFGGGIVHSMLGDASDFSVHLELDDGQGGNPRRGEFRLDMAHLGFQGFPANGNGLVGHTPGGAALTGGVFDRLLRTGFDTSGPGEAQVEEHITYTLVPGRIGWDGMGSPRGYNAYAVAWDQASVLFTPNAVNGIPGSFGYATQSLGPIPLDIFLAITPATTSVTGGQVLTLTGSFLGFDPAGTGAGTVVFDPMGAHGGPFPAPVLGILDNSGQSGPLSILNPVPGPHRDGQALQILVPLLGGPGQYLVQVNFASGSSQTWSVTATLSGIVTSSYVLGDDDSVVVGLVNPLSFYGQTFSSLQVNSNGYVTFNGGVSIPNESMPLFFDGTEPAAATPMVAVWFSDLNPLGGMSGATYEVIEDTVNGIVTCAFNNQIHKASNAPAGSFSCVFDPYNFLPGSVVLDYSGFIPGPNPADDGIIGISDGDASTTALGTDTNLTNGFGSGLVSVQGIYASPGPRDSIGEQIPAGVSPPFPGNTVVFYHLGGGQFLIQ